MPVNRAKLETVGSGQFRVSGQLDAASVVNVLKESRDRFAESKAVDVDLSGVTESDSAGLALLLEWLRLSRVDERLIRFHNLPPQICALAHISEVDELLAANLEEEMPAETPATAPATV